MSDTPSNSTGVPRRDADEDPPIYISIWDQQPVIPENPSPQLRAVLDFIQGLQDSDFPLVSTKVTDDFRMSILPQSLGVPCRHKDEWLETCKRASILCPKSFRVSSLFLFYSDWSSLLEAKLDILDINESPGKLWLHGIGSARAKVGRAYENEYLMMFKLTDGKESPDGEPKISEMKEFMDSLYTSNWAAEVGKSLSQIK